MAAPTGYDLGLQHASVNAGVAVGFLLDEGHPAPFVEERGVVASPELTTAGVVSVASYGPGLALYRIRLALHTNILRRDGRPASETPATLRGLLLAFAAIADGTLRLETDTLSRRVAFTEAVTLISGPGIDGYRAELVLVDIGG